VRAFAERFLTLDCSTATGAKVTASHRYLSPDGDPFRLHDGCGRNRGRLRAARWRDPPLQIVAAGG